MTAVANAQTYALVFFLFPRSYVTAVHSDRPGIFEALAPPAPPPPPVRPAQTGETVQIFGTGFGPTCPAIDPGQLAFRPAQLRELGKLRVTIGGMPARVAFAGLLGPGLYELNVTIPEGLRPDDHEIVARIGGTQTPPGTMISVGGPPAR